jgi:DNA-binding NtrC family response regulator
VSDVTSTIANAQHRQIRLRRMRLRCVVGAELGNTWELEQDLVRIGSQAGSHVLLTDDTVSRRHAELVRTRDGVLLRDLESRNGTFVGPIRIKEVFLPPDARFRVGRSELVFSSKDEVLETRPSEEPRFEGLVGQSLAMREVFGVLSRVAPTDLTVLLTGETGTGKELASRALHARSRRVGGPFVVFDCGAAPENLIESELFGHKKGAFTGAVEGRPGVFELAHGGTIFLDEVGELPLELQPKLLRALEQREVRRVGDSRTVSVDVRVVAATNRDLTLEVAAGRFREDLYYRLAVVELRLPPLRERLSDLPLLIDHILRVSPHNRGVRGLSPEVSALLEAWRWPGNIRELSNVIGRALPFCDGELIELSALPAGLRSAQVQPPGAAGGPIPVSTGPANTGPSLSGEALSALPFKDAKDQMVEAFERAYLIDLIDRYDGNVSRAATAAGIDRKSITRLMKKHGITRQTTD